MDDKRHPLLLAGMALLAALHLQGCSPPPRDAAPTPSASIVQQASSAPTPAPAPAPAPARPASAPEAPGTGAGNLQAGKHHAGHAARPRGDIVGAAPPPPAASAATSATTSRYPHVDAIFYAETPERVGNVAKACLEVLPPGVGASSVNASAYQCKPQSPATAMTAGTPVAKDDGTPGVDTAEYMKATLDFDSGDFDVPTRELLLHFTSPGQHKSFEFQVIPKRIGERRLAVQLFTTDKDGVVIDDIFDGSSTVHVQVGSDPVANLGWLLEHWEALAAVGASLLALWGLLTGRLLAWWRRRSAGSSTSARPDDDRQP